MTILVLIIAIAELKLRSIAKYMENLNRVQQPIYGVKDAQIVGEGFVMTLTKL